MPAYDLNGAYSVFFIIFMLVNLYLFINIILATIYSNYKRHLKAEVISTIKLKLTKSKDAFELIKVAYNAIKPPVDNGTETANSVEFKETEYLRSTSQHVITYPRFEKLMKLIDPNKKENQIRIIFELIDFDNNNLLSGLFFLSI
jgi:hypothetical protein